MNLSDGVDSIAADANTPFMTLTWLWTAALATNYLIGAFVIGSILRRQREPMAMLAWIFAIMLIPVGGWALYWLVGSTRIHRTAHRRRKRIAPLISRVRRHARKPLGDRAGTPGARAPPDLSAA